MLEATRSSESPVITRVIRRHIPEGGIFQSFNVVSNWEMESKTRGLLPSGYRCPQGICTDVCVGIFTVSAVNEDWSAEGKHSTGIPADFMLLALTVFIILLLTSLPLELLYY
jgi:hypothetical protein